MYKEFTSFPITALCLTHNPTPGSYFIFLKVELGGLNSATIDGFAAPLRSSFSLGKTPEANSQQSGCSKGKELQTDFPNELWL